MGPGNIAQFPDTWDASEKYWACNPRTKHTFSLINAVNSCYKYTHFMADDRILPMLQGFGQEIS
jgi:hypothetical protein